MAPNYKQIDPCTDFDEYACAGWRIKNRLSGHRMQQHAAEKMSDDVVRTVHDILDGVYVTDYSLTQEQLEADKELFYTLKKTYNTCLDTESIKATGLTPLVKLIDGLAEEGVKGNYSSAVLYMEELAVPAFFAMTVREDQKGTNVFHAVVEPTTSLEILPNTGYADPEQVQGYQKAMQAVLEGLQPKLSKAKITRSGGTAADMAEAITRFEASLLAPLPPLDDFEDPNKTETPMTLDEADALFPFLDLNWILTSLAPQLHGADNIRVTFPDVLAKIMETVKNTDPEVLNAYLYWRLAVAYRDAVIAPEIVPLKELYARYHKMSKKAKGERWEQCTRFVMTQLSRATDRYFVARAFSPAARTEVAKMAVELKKSFVYIFHRSWMDRDTQKKVFNKLRKMTVNVGYPVKRPSMYNPIELKDHVDLVNISNSHISNLISLTQSHNANRWGAVGIENDITGWDTSAMATGTFHRFNENKVLIPSGIIQFPFYQRGVPNYLNYAGIGTIMAHEMAHMFDHTARQYDDLGAFGAWWPEDMQREFRAREQCFVDQYDRINYTTETESIATNGQKTAAENMADALGIQVAWEAWTRLWGDQSARVYLPDIDLSMEQVFFVASAQQWCSVERPEALDPMSRHAPFPVRIKGAMMNSAGFKEAFSCPNKKPTCSIF